MEYGGTVMLGEEYLVTGELMYEFDPVPGEKIALNPTNLKLDMETRYRFWCIQIYLWRTAIWR